MWRNDVYIEHKAKAITCYSRTLVLYRGGEGQCRSGIGPTLRIQRFGQLVGPFDFPRDPATRQTLQGKLIAGRCLANDFNSESSRRFYAAGIVLQLLRSTACQFARVISTCICSGADSMGHYWIGDVSSLSCTRLPGCSYFPKRKLNYRTFK